MQRGANRLRKPRTINYTECYRSEGKATRTQATLDFGAKIPIGNEELVQHKKLEEIGKVSMQCVVGDLVLAEVMKLNARLCDEKVEHSNLVNFGPDSSSLHAVFEHDYG